MIKIQFPIINTGDSQSPQGNESAGKPPFSVKIAEKLIQAPFRIAYNELMEHHYMPGLGTLTSLQFDVLRKIALCGTEEAGYSVYECGECGYISHQYNKCKDRNCPVCQNLNGMLWVDKQRSESVVGPYFHLVATVPHQLNPLIYENQSTLYSLLHKSLSSSIIELARDPKYLGGTPGIIQVLHTWSQELNYHVHMHAVVTGVGLTPDKKLVECRNNEFFIPTKVLSAMVRGKFMDSLKELRKNNSLQYTGQAEKFRNTYEWKELVNSLYDTDWIGFIKSTCNANDGDAIEYLSKYVNKIAIGNNRIISVTREEVEFTVRGKDGTQSERRKLSVAEFVRRYLQHVLPKGFQKIRHYGFLANGCKKAKLEVINSIQNPPAPGAHKYKEPTRAEVLRVEFGVNVHACPCCGKTDTVRISKTVLGKFSYTTKMSEDVKYMKATAKHNRLVTGAEQKAG